jgi:hypothetical protein
MVVHLVVLVLMVCSGTRIVLMTGDTNNGDVHVAETNVTVADIIEAIVIVANVVD